MLPSGVCFCMSTEDRVRSRMRFRSKREVLAHVAPCSQLASPAQKSVILDAFVAVAHDARTYALCLLTQPPLPMPAQIHRPRAPKYRPAVHAALEIAWVVVNIIGGCFLFLQQFDDELSLEARSVKLFYRYIVRDLVYWCVSVLGSTNSLHASDLLRKTLRGTVHGVA